MAWINYSDGEVAVFHVVFHEIADDALRGLGLAESYSWDHHPGDSAAGIPDFVLRDRETGRWILVVEIKRTRQAVWSTLFQLQAKGYAESNQSKYRNGYAAYYAITNLELTILGALNGSLPPKDCVLKDGVRDTGTFGGTDEALHRQAVHDAISDLIKQVVENATPEYDQVWPAVINRWLSYSADIPGIAAIEIERPRTIGWDVVESYFAPNMNEASRRILLLRCLAVEYIRGALTEFNHPQSASFRPLRPDLKAIAASMAAIRQIDFNAIFESGSPAMYTRLDDPAAIALLRAYIGEITTGPRRIAELATRIDSPALLESLLTAITPPDKQHLVGKVQTDPELASVLASIAIQNTDSVVFDAGCGDGALITAAYDRLAALGVGAGHIQTQLSAIEADPISLRVAALRLALREPRSVSNVNQANLVFGDMFTRPDLVAAADVVVANPPFKRYESQDDYPVPQALREHYARQIIKAGGDAFSLDGQSNLYSFYVEYLASTVKEGATIGLILDNKWYHNKYAVKLRQLILDKFKIIALVEYPHTAFFRAWMISTSLLIIRRSDHKEIDHEVQFVQCRVDPRVSDLKKLSKAIRREAPWPLDWAENRKLQSELNAESGWKSCFGQRLVQEYRDLPMPTLAELFPRSRRGSLNKEGGGTEVFEFPYNRTNYGPRRVRLERPGRFATAQGSPLSPDENSRLRELAGAIPEEYRGYALKNADGLSGYELSIADVSRDWTIEPPLLRSRPQLFQTARRSRWTDAQDDALVAVRDNPQLSAYIDEIDTVVGLAQAIPSDQRRWIVLQEPYAGELIIPRKVRDGHRVHINPFALNVSGRQVRLSSNFISYGGLVAVDLKHGLDRRSSLELVVSYLLSSFGQLQFESNGYNREGLLALEKMHMDPVRVFDPRWVGIASRQRILEALTKLQYPVSSDADAAGSRTQLDELWAEEIVRRFGGERDELVAEVQGLLAELIFAREP